jgi:hypothetical protein
MKINRREVPNRHVYTFIYIGTRLTRRALPVCTTPIVVSLRLWQTSSSISSSFVGNPYSASPSTAGDVTAAPTPYSPSP